MSPLRLLIAAVLLATAIGWDASQVRAQEPGGIPGLPGLTADGQRTPLYLLNALLTVPFTESALPEGYANPVISLWEYGDDDLAGAIGGVIIGLNGGDSASVNFIVYPDSTTAETNLLLNTANTGTPAPIATSMAGASERVGIAYEDYVVCLEQSGEVVVIGGRLLEASETPANALTEACALVDAGLVHLEAVRAS